MSAFDERRTQDVLKLHELAARSYNRVRITRVAGNPANEIDVELHLKTAPSQDYPLKVQPVTRFCISLPARYPFAEPTVNISTPILHPNVYTSGRICLGVKWIPSFGLDLLVRRVAQIIAYDPAVLNVQSPANSAAVSWYKQAAKQHPRAFPTDVLDFSVAEQPKTMSWKNAEPPSYSKVVLSCPNCAAKLSILEGKAGTVRCPKCNTRFSATT